ncbi:MAG: hypothetical protein J0M25_00765 [Flavobacteriales bacterium]|nr:hypothetical protein [Flavobacteriales bacterium]
MKFIPILFSTEMVQAILAGRKTQTRRTKGLHAVTDCYFQSLVLHTTGKYTFVPNGNFNPSDKNFVEVKCPYGRPDDVLWVRETLYQNGELGLEYVADNESIDEDIIPHNFNFRLDKNDNYKFCKIPNIYMEKWACRLFLRIKDIRVERLQNISEQDIQNEGIVYDGKWVLGKENNALSFLPEGVNLRDNPPTLYQSLFAKWAELWCSINKIDSWNSNPWVWVIEFEKIEKPDDFC